MIKKNLFEDEIISEMQRELQPSFVKQSSLDLVKAADYLNAAFEIFEETGLTIHANLILDILTKIAVSKLQKLPAIQVLLDAGITEKDFLEFGQGSQFAKAKINKALRDANFKDSEIANFIGKDNVLPEKEIEEFGPTSSLNRILKMVEYPKNPIPNSSKLNPDEEIEIESLASQHKKNKNPGKISDRHTKGLTSDKMIKNLLHHGTEFNMADDGINDDLLNLEINDQGLEIYEDKLNPEMGFEDEI